MKLIASLIRPAPLQVSHLPDLVLKENVLAV
jgi:hypothetical protein